MWSLVRNPSTNQWLQRRLQICLLLYHLFIPGKICCRADCGTACHNPHRPEACKYAYISFLLFVCVCFRKVVSNTYCVVVFFLSSMLPVSMYYPFLIASSVLSNVYSDDCCLFLRKTNEQPHRIY